MKAVMYGAGNIGRGFIVQSFYESGYETALIDVNMAVVDRLNADGRYPVYITKNGEYEIHPVERVRGVDGRDVQAVAEAIAEADVMATAVGVNVLKFIAPNIAAGVTRRFELGIETPLNCIVCENMIGADHYLSEMIRGYLSPEAAAYFDRCFAAVEPSIGRMVPATPASILEKEPLAVCVEEYFELPVDKASFKGEIPPIRNLVPFTPFDFYIRRKLFMHNMSHAVTAYLGKEKGYELIWQAAADGEIREAVARALRAISAAMSAEYGVASEELAAFSDNLLLRYDNKLLGDTVDRVGKDTVRKLGENDRLIGAARLCVKHGIDPAPICRGIAAALRFAPEGDEAAASVATMAAEKGPEAALAHFSGLSEEDQICSLACAMYRKGQG